MGLIRTTNYDYVRTGMCWSTSREGAVERVPRRSLTAR
jgi:hypothetical protein